MAAVRQHQTGRLAGITIAAMLSVAATAGVAGAKTLDGAAASQMIVDRLAREGLDGTPAIKAGREFPACDGALSVEPMFGSWNTVSLACDGASKWRFAIRTNDDAATARADARVSGRRAAEGADRACSSKPIQRP